MLGCWCPKFSIFLNSFHNRVEFGTILEGLRNPPPLGTPLQLDTRVVGQLTSFALQLKQILKSHSIGREAV